MVLNKLVSEWWVSPAGLPPGTVVITDKAVDSFFRPQFEQVVLGQVIVRSTELDKGLAQELLRCSSELPALPAIISDTMCTSDFYEGGVPSTAPRHSAQRGRGRCGTQARPAQS